VDGWVGLRFDGRRLEGSGERGDHPGCCQSANVLAGFPPPEIALALALRTVAVHMNVVIDSDPTLGVPFDETVSSACNLGIGIERNDLIGHPLNPEDDAEGPGLRPGSLRRYSGRHG